MVQAQSIKIISVNKVTELKQYFRQMTCRTQSIHSGIDKASAYIESLFKKIGLETFDGAKTTSRNLP
jgi:hypothetical protein